MKIAFSLMPAPPSLIVHSGHGLHAYWLFECIELVETEESREGFARLEQRWQDHLRDLARAKGWTIDSTHDLARVFRLPGTKNHKEADAVADVRVITESKTSYTPVKLTDYLDSLPTPLEGTKAKHREERPTPATRNVGPLVLDSKANPPLKTFEMLGEVEPSRLLKK
jgi:putative DNA primase/helicase